MSQLIENKSEFQELAEIRLAEAKALLDVGKWDGAYYLAGYAVELALKSCIIKKVMATDAFPEKRFSEKCYTHDIATLVELAGLDDARKNAMDADAELKDNWDVARDWSEQKRYHRILQGEAEVFYKAVADDVRGILSWIKLHW